MKPSPCKDCEKRDEYCHASCGDYIKYRADMDADIERRDRARKVTMLNFSGTNYWRKERAKAERSKRNGHKN